MPHGQIHFHRFKTACPAEIFLYHQPAVLSLHALSSCPVHAGSSCFFCQKYPCRRYSFFSIPSFRNGGKSIDRSKKAVFPEENSFFEACPAQTEHLRQRNEKPCNGKVLRITSYRPCRRPPASEEQLAFLPEYHLPQLL